MAGFSAPSSPGRVAVTSFTTYSSNQSDVTVAADVPVVPGGGGGQAARRAYGGQLGQESSIYTPQKIGTLTDEVEAKIIEKEPLPEPKPEPIPEEVEIQRTPEPICGDGTCTFPAENEDSCPADCIFEEPKDWSWAFYTFMVIMILAIAAFIALATFSRP